MTETTNPLKQYFRQPAIYARLPSQGKFWPEGTVAIPPNGELPIYPMTAVDEITTRTPDALFNGTAVIRIFESCVPSVKDAWSMPAIDVDTLLVAVRIATYGHDMDVNTRCPNCDAQNEYQMDLRTILENIKTPNYETSLDIQGLKFYFRPLSYLEMNENNQLQFEDQKAMQSVTDADVDDKEKMKRLGESFLRITALTIKSIAQSISAIRTADAVVTDTKHVLEFLQNCERSVFNTVRDHIVKLKQESETAPLKITCNECSTEFDQPFTLDMSNFFVTNS
jgi:hypothetical protein